MDQNIGKIQPVEITAEMQKSYLDYAMSVIVARALPDVRDGLKPVHRRIFVLINLCLSDITNRLPREFNQEFLSVQVRLVDAIPVLVYATRT